MTAKEAIEKLRAYHKCQSLQVKGIYEDCNEKLCDNCDLCYAQGNAGEHIESIEIAIQALKKQIPKKPNYEREQTSPFGEDDVPYCPRCKLSLPESVNYCEKCGQKILWEDE